MSEVEQTIDNNNKQTTDEDTQHQKDSSNTENDVNKQTNNNHDTNNGTVIKSKTKDDIAKPQEKEAGDIKSEAPKRAISDVEDEKTDRNGTKKELTSTRDEDSKKIKLDGSQTETKIEEEASEEHDKDPTGMLLICGGANWDMTGRKELPKGAKKPAKLDPAARNLWEPHRVVLEPGKSLRVRGVFSGCNACHSVIVLDDGTVMTFGRNDKGQLGLGDTETRFTPVAVDALKEMNIVSAACGRSHTLFLSAEGIVYACGMNKMGQCGTNQPNIPEISTPTKIIFKENKPIVRLACGAEFSLIVDVDGNLYSFGSPEHGQLGHNSEGKYFTTGNKYAFHNEYMPRRIVTFIEKSREGHITPLDDVWITEVACGTNHSLAVDKKGRCYSWGFGGYHRLGHSETKNELVPRSIKTFDGPPSSGRGAAKVFCGATHSMSIDINGLLYFWGQNKSSGEATMYPKNVQDLCGWKIRDCACANRSIVVCADESCISWGPSPTYGELGYGEGKSKSSTTPQEVKILDGIFIMQVVCGYGHTLFMAKDKTKEEQDKLNKMFCWP